MSGNLKMRGDLKMRGNLKKRPSCPGERQEGKGPAALGSPPDDPWQGKRRSKVSGE